MQVPPGRCYSHFAYGEQHMLAAVYGCTLHFLNAKSGERMESVPEAHDEDITAMEWMPQRPGLSA